MDGKNNRRIYIETLTGTWLCAFKKKFSAGAKTRDERFVALRVRIARHEDVRSILEAAWPYDPDADIKNQSMPPLASEWLKAHKAWVDDAFADVVNAAIGELRAFKRDRRALLRASYRTVARRDRRCKIRNRGPLPPLAVGVKPVVKKRA